MRPIRVATGRSVEAEARVVMRSPRWWSGGCFVQAEIDQAAGRKVVGEQRRRLGILRFVEGGGERPACEKCGVDSPRAFAHATDLDAGRKALHRQLRRARARISLGKSGVIR